MYACCKSDLIFGCLYERTTRAVLHMQSLHPSRLRNVRIAFQEEAIQISKLGESESPSWSSSPQFSTFQEYPQAVCMHTQATYTHLPTNIDTVGGLHCPIRSYLRVPK